MNNSILTKKDEQMAGSRLLMNTLSLSIPNVGAYNEAERIKRCFLPGFCMGSIKSLPTIIKPGALNKNKQEAILASNLKSEKPKIIVI